MNIYENRVIAFIDILGFSEVVKNQEKAQLILNALTEIKKEIDKQFASECFTKFQGVLDTQITAFSDSVVISGYPSQVMPVYGNACTFSRLLIERGFLCRGAISVGELYHNNGILFGQAFIDAYNAEKQRAIYPRIILDKEVITLIEDSESFKNEFLNLIRNDFDNELFIDLFKFYEVFMGQGNEVKNKLKEIASPQENHDKSVAQKINWLINTYKLNEK